MRLATWMGTAFAFVVAGLFGCESTPFREAHVDLAGGPRIGSGGEAAEDAHRLRFAVAAMESAKGTAAAYDGLLAAVSRGMRLPVELVQRRTYREINDMLATGQLDAALVCTGGYLDLERRIPGAVEILAVPVIDGAATYQSLVIVPAASPARSLDDLAGKRFAYTDEISFSGHLYLAAALRLRGVEPERFFAETVFTHSHDRSVEAVAEGITDGAVVSSVVYRHLTERWPALARKTRVIHRSTPFGMMPVIASTRLSAAEREQLRGVLLDMHVDPAAADALSALHIERFDVSPTESYDSAAAFAGLVE